MFYLKAALIIFWFWIASFIGFFMALFRWGDLDLDHDIGRLITGIGLKLAGIRIRLEGGEHLTSYQPCIYVGNHQHAIDVLTLGSVYPRRTITVGKKELIWVPFFGIAFAAAGNILIDRSNRARAMASLERAVQALKEKRASILIFPEGTRNRSSEGLLPFKKGAFHMAIMAGVPIVPIVCQSLNDLPGWKEGKLLGGELRIRVLPPISTQGLTSKDLDRLTTEVRARMEEAFRGLSSHRP